MDAVFPGRPRVYSQGSGPVAQWLERGAHNSKVAGSIPAGPTTPAFARHHRVHLEHSIRRFRASFAGDVRFTYQILEVTAMPIAYLEPTRASAEAIETTPAVAREPVMLPAATVLLVPYATDEVEWHQADERFPQR